MKLKIYLFLFSISLMACKKKSEDAPEPNTAINKPVSISDCNGVLFTRPVSGFNPGDTIRAKNSILYMHCQNKTDATSNGCYFGTYEEVLKGDFILKITINNLSLSTSVSPEPGLFKITLSNIFEDKIVRRLHSIVSTTGFSWASYPDTLAFKKPSLPLPTTFRYQLTRLGANLRAVLYFENDSLVAQNVTFGAEDLSLGFVISSDTSGRQSSSVRITDLQIKQGLGTYQKENFGCDANFYPR